MTTTYAKLILREAWAYPPIGRRVLAAAIDALVVLVGMLIIGETLGDVGPAWAPARGILIVGLWWAYEPGCTAFGATIGQRVFRFRVRRAADPRRRINLAAAWVRCVVKYTLGIVSFLAMLFTKRRRALHDIVSGSIVLEVDALPTDESIDPYAT